MKWKNWVLFMGLLWICDISGQAKKEDKNGNKQKKYKIKQCLTSQKQSFLVPDTFNGIINASSYLGKGDCIVFLQKKNQTNQTNDGSLSKHWPRMETKNKSLLLYIFKFHVMRKLNLIVLDGRNCSAYIKNNKGTGSCNISYLQTETCSRNVYDEKMCKGFAQVKDQYIFQLPNTNCLNCNNPVKVPDEALSSKDLKDLDSSLDFGGADSGKGEISSAQAADAMAKMSNIATSINGSSAALSLGGGVEGVLVKEKDPDDVEEVSFGYNTPSASINIIDSPETLWTFSRSVTIPKEAFQQASLNTSEPFAAVLRFLNMSKDEKNSIVLGNEVLAIEMGTMISNLTNKLSVNFLNMKYDGVPSCQSWNGEGGRPNWTDAGCSTTKKGNNITCQCTHLTFFAILLGSPEEAISSSDLKTLTTITKIGCGLSLFFLSIVYFMYCLLRRTKASKATKILMQLVSALFLLNITFLINNNVANLGSSVGCTIMAAVMHYAMLASFTWFAAQAFHLCLQLRLQGKIDIHHYVLKMSVISWVLPSVIVIILLATSKYGEQIIQTSDNMENVTMCWITDNTAHYVVNIGYYALIFIFTIITFIIIVTWLFCLKRSKAANTEANRNGAQFVSILGLCSMLGISWGFAFFAHGALLIPSYYIFTVINSLQGFFLFIYYYKTREVMAGKGITIDSSSSSSSTSGTLKTAVDNPYADVQDVKSTTEG